MTDTKIEYFVYPSPSLPKIWLSPAEYAIAEDLAAGRRALMPLNTFTILVREKYKLGEAMSATLMKGAHGH